MSRAIVWFAAAVVVAVGILPDTIVQGALASGGIPSQVVAGDSQADADRHIGRRSDCESHPTNPLALADVPGSTVMG